MDAILAQLLQATLLLFVALDTIGNIPVSLVLTQKMQPENRKKNIRAALSIASVLLFLFLFFGQFILDIFNVSLSDFRIAGGIVLVFIGLKLVLNLRLLEMRAEKYHSAVVPMATPLITGPAVITAVILIVHTYGLLIAVMSAAVNLIFTWLVLSNLEFFNKFLGRQGADVVSKIMGLILVAVAIGLIRAGI